MSGWVKHVVLEYIRESVRLYEHPRPEHALVLTDRMFPPSHPKYYADEDLTDATDCCRVGMRLLCGNGFRHNRWIHRRA